MEQLERARELKDAMGEAQAFGNMGITRMNLSHFEEAIGNFEAQLESLEKWTGAGAREKARVMMMIMIMIIIMMMMMIKVLANLGDCYDALGELGQSVRYHEQFLALALKTRSVRDQDRAYRGLGNTHRSLGNLQDALVSENHDDNDNNDDGDDDNDNDDGSLQDALVSENHAPRKTVHVLFCQVCFEKRLVISHDLSEPGATAAAYGELGDIHRMLGHFEQSISCMERRIEMAR